MTIKYDSAKPIDVSFVSPLAGSDLLLCAIFGGAISGVGSGLTIRLGGAIDGIDVLSVTFAKRIGISLGSFVMIFNTTLYVICGMGMRGYVACRVLEQHGYDCKNLMGGFAFYREVKRGGGLRKKSATACGAEL